MPLNLWPESPAQQTEYGMGWYAQIVDVDKTSVAFRCQGEAVAAQLSKTVFMEKCGMLIEESSHPMWTLEDDLIGHIFPLCTLGALVSLHGTCRRAMSHVRCYFRANHVIHRAPLDLGTTDTAPSEHRTCEDVLCMVNDGITLVCNTTNSGRIPSKWRAVGFVGGVDFARSGIQRFNFEVERRSVITAIAVCGDYIACALEMLNGGGRVLVYDCSQTDTPMIVPCGTSVTTLNFKNHFTHPILFVGDAWGCITLGYITRNSNGTSTHHSSPPYYLRMNADPTPGVASLSLLSNVDSCMVAVFEDGHTVYTTVDNEAVALTRILLSPRVLRNAEEGDVWTCPWTCGYHVATQDVSGRCGVIAVTFGRFVDVYEQHGPQTPFSSQFVRWGWQHRVGIGTMGSSVTALMMHNGLLWAATTAQGCLTVWDGVHRKATLDSGHGSSVTGISTFQGKLVTCALSHSNGAKTLLVHDLPCLL